MYIYPIISQKAFYESLRYPPIHTQQLISIQSLTVILRLLYIISNNPFHLHYYPILQHFQSTENVKNDRVFFSYKFKNSFWHAFSGGIQCHRRPAWYIMLKKKVLVVLSSLIAAGLSDRWVTRMSHQRKFAYPTNWLDFQVIDGRCWIPTPQRRSHLYLHLWTITFVLSWCVRAFGNVIYIYIYANQCT